MESGKLRNNKKKTQAQPGPALFGLGLGFIGLSLIALLAIFYPTISNEIKYRFSPPDSEAEVVLTQVKNSEEEKKYIVAADPFFSIVIPKIGANAKVIKDVDAQDSRVYQKALTEGVAHAKNTALPGQVGNTFLFAHSSDNFVAANRYNSIFYLLNKLEEGDEIYLIFNRRKYIYEVKETKVVSPEEISYLDSKSDAPKVTLMTCWPAGTTLKRLVVVAELQPR